MSRTEHPWFVKRTGPRPLFSTPKPPIWFACRLAASQWPVRPANLTHLHKIIKKRIRMDGNSSLIYCKITQVVTSFSSHFLVWTSCRVTTLCCTHFSWIVKLSSSDVQFINKPFIWKTRTIINPFHFLHKHINTTAFTFNAQTVFRVL